MNFGMRKNEVRTFLLIAAVALIAAIGYFAWWGVSAMDLDRSKDSYGEFQKENAVVYQQGDTVSGDSHVDEQLSTEAGWFYSAGFDWNGTMNWKVIDSWLYDTPGDAGISEDTPGFFSPMPEDLFESDDFVFLICEVQIDNIDAQPESGSRSFNIATLRTGWLGYFDGTYAGAGAKDGWAYELAPGASGVYHVGYYIKNPDTHPEFLVASLGSASTDVDKIGIRLSPHDLRGDDR